MKIALTALILPMTLVPACVGTVGDESSTAGSSRQSLSAYQAAHDAIALVRPLATRLFADKLGAMLMRRSPFSTAVEVGINAPLTSAELAKTCPLLAPKKGSNTKSCRSLAQQAGDPATQDYDSLWGDIVQKLTQQYSGKLSEDELGFVKGWAGEALRSGVAGGAAHAVNQLRKEGACDEGDEPADLATRYGEEQGKALLEKTEQAVLPTIPKNQCNTDVIAETVYTEAKTAADKLVAEHPLCAGVPPASLPPNVDLAKLQADYKAGIQEGLRQAKEALRVRLFNTSTCDRCLCVAGMSGYRPTICFTEEVLKKAPGDFGSVLDDVKMQSSFSLAALAVQNPNQCQPAACRAAMDKAINARLCRGSPTGFEKDLYRLNNGFCFDDLATSDTAQAKQIRAELDQACVKWEVPVVVGSPLVVDLDGDGVRFSAARVSFDLAATGEPALIPALEGGDGFLALDLDGNGRIDSGAELFGNATSCGARRCSDGVEALARHDRNRDGVIDSKDAVYSRLRVWRDANRNGESEAHELYPLAAAGIRSISLGARLDFAFVAAGGHSATRTLVFERMGGGRGLIPDVWFNLAFDRMPQDPRTSGIVTTSPARLR
jgi:hypothetical protein